MLADQGHAVGAKGGMKPALEPGAKRRGSRHGIDRDEYLRDATLYASRGTSRPNAKLNPDRVRWIRRNPEGLTRRKMAERLGVHQRTVDAVIDGRNWVHVA